MVAPKFSFLNQRVIGVTYKGLFIKHKGNCLPKNPPQHEWWPRMLHPWSFLGNVRAVIPLRTSFPAVVWEVTPMARGGVSAATQRSSPRVKKMDSRKKQWFAILSLPRTNYLHLLTVLSFSHFPLFPVKDTLLIYAPFYWDVRSLKRSLVFALQSAVDLWLLMLLSPSHPGSCMFASLLRNRVLESWET